MTTAEVTDHRHSYKKKFSFKNNIGTTDKKEIAYIIHLFYSIIGSLTAIDNTNWQTLDDQQSCLEATEMSD